MEYQVQQIMGMPIGIDVRDLSIPPDAVARAFQWFRTVDLRFSTYKSDSEISLLNRGEITLADVHPDVREVLARCEQLRFETGGYFDARAAFEYSGARDRLDRAVEWAVDPSGLVKGWAVERAAALLHEEGLSNYSINAGGDIRVRGEPEPGTPWRIGIQHPVIMDKVAAVVEGTDLAIATSGTYIRGDHIVNPGEGTPPRGVLSVTIVGPDLGTADAYATAAFAMGEAGPAWTATLVGAGYEALSIMEDDTVLSTPGFPRAGEW